MGWFAPRRAFARVTINALARNTGGARRGRHFVLRQGHRAAAPLANLPANTLSLRVLARPLASAAAGTYSAFARGCAPNGDAHSTENHMRTTSYFFATVRTGALVAALAMSAVAGAHAQSRATPLESGKAFDLTPYAGYMVFGDYIKGPLGTSLSNAPAPVYGAQLGMRLAPNISLVGNVATTSSDIKAGIPILGGFSVAHRNLLLYDAGLQLDIPVATMGGTSFSPFVQAGAGAI